MPNSSFRILNSSNSFSEHYFAIRSEFAKRFYVILSCEISYRMSNIFTDKKLVNPNNCINFVFCLLDLYIDNIDKMMIDNPFSRKGLESKEITKINPTTQMAAVSILIFAVKIAFPEDPFMHEAIEELIIDSGLFEEYDRSITLVLSEKDRSALCTQEAEFIRGHQSDDTSNAETKRELVVLTFKVLIDSIKSIKNK